MSKSLLKQLLLFVIGVLLLLFTYFLTPKKINLDDISEKKENIIELDQEKVSKNENLENVQNTFENLKYSGQDLKGNTYEIGSEYALIKKDSPDTTFMYGGVIAYIYLTDGRIVKIVSEVANYNRLDQNMSFEENVIVTEAKNKLNSDNLDFDTKQNFIIAYNNVEFENEEGLIFADKILVDLTNKTSKISMYDDKQVRAKILK